MPIIRLAFSSLFFLSSILVFGQYDPNEKPTDWKHEEMIVHNDRPWNIESPVHLLDDAITPTDKMFVRNNGLIPTDLDEDSWTLTIEGESVPNPKTYSLNELKTKFTHYTYSLVLECGGNGRGEINPPATGNQWGYGAVNCGSWTGVRLKDVLEDVGIKSSLMPTSSKTSFSRTPVQLPQFTAPYPH